MSINSMERNPRIQNLPRGVEPSSSLYGNHANGAVDRWAVTPDIVRASTYEAPELYSPRVAKDLGRSALSIQVPERDYK